MAATTHTYRTVDEAISAAYARNRGRKREDNIAILLDMNGTRPHFRIANLGGEWSRYGSTFYNGSRVLQVALLSNQGMLFRYYAKDTDARED